MNKIHYATRYKTTLSQDIDEIAKKGYGRNAHPILLPNKDIPALISANCRPKDPFKILKAYRMFIP